MSSEKIKRKIKISRGNVIYIIAVAIMLRLCLAALLSALNTEFCDWWKAKVFIPYTDFMRDQTRGAETFFGKYIVMILLSYLAIVVLILILGKIFKTDSYKHFSNGCLKSVLIVILSIVLFCEMIWYIPLNATLLDGSYTGKEPVTDEILFEFYAYLTELNKQINDEAVFPDNDESADTIQRSAARLSAQFTGLAGAYPDYKLFSRDDSHICAYTLPLTAEVVMEDDINGWGFISMYAHQLAHNKGYLKESEAEFIAWKICMESDDPYYRQCGLVKAMDLVEYVAMKRIKVNDFNSTYPDWSYTFDRFSVGTHNDPFFISPLFDTNAPYDYRKWAFMDPVMTDELVKNSDTDGELGWKIKRKISGDKVYEEVLSLMVEDYRRYQKDKDSI